MPVITGICWVGVGDGENACMDGWEWGQHIGTVGHGNVRLCVAV